MCNNVCYIGKTVNVGCYYFRFCFFLNQSLSLYIKSSYISRTLLISLCSHKLLNHYLCFNISRIKLCFGKSHILIFSLENMLPITYTSHAQNIILEMFTNVMRELIFVDLGLYLVVKP